MNNKKSKTQERMQTQSKPSNRNNERNNFKTIDNNHEKEVFINKKSNSKV